MFFIKQGNVPLLIVHQSVTDFNEFFSCRVYSMFFDSVTLKNYSYTLANT